MKTMKLARATLLASSALFVSTISSPVAVAQEAPAEDAFAGESAVDDAISADVIVVTGSRIARPDLESASPVSVVSEQAIELSGKPGVEEFLREIPQVVGAVGSNTNNGNPGVATVDLRNLGEERTLVLVDGKRFVPYDYDGVVDLNMIPSALVKRVEVVTGGASAVYGSDAIAGVVNFIMKDDFEGIEADAQYGITDQADGNTWQVSLTGGTNFADGRGNVTISGSYAKQEAVNQGARDFSREALAAADFSPGGSFTNAAGFLDLGPNGYSFGSDGSLSEYPEGFEAFNFNPYNLLQTPYEKYNATVLAHYEISDAAEVFARGSYGKTKVKTIIAPTGTFFYPFDINYRDNPFLNDEARDIIGSYDTDGDGIVSASIGRRLTELGTRDSVFNNEAWQIVGGVRGDLGSSLSYEVFAQYGRTDRTINYLNDVAYDRIFQAILADSNGCIDPSNGCVPANIFGAGNLSSEAAEFIRVDLSEKNRSTQFVTGGFLTGDLPFSITSRPGAFVVGAEYRRETGKVRPDQNLIEGNSVGFGSSTPIDANFDVMEAYAEVKMPILRDLPFVQEFNLEGGVRYADYSNKVVDLGTSNSFSNWSWKFGADWKPVEPLRLRAMYQRAVRAPNIGEIGQPSTPSTGDATFDPCAGANPVGNQALTDLCIATGVPAGNVGNVGGPISGQINNYIGGNPNLTPEKSETLTIGAVYTPTRNISLTVDYFDIKVKDAILQIPEQAVLDACYGIEKDASGFYCSLIHRNPLSGRLSGGTETGVDVRNQNIGFLRSSGIDFSASWAIPVGNTAKLNLAFNGTHVLKSQLQFADFLPVNECKGLVGKTCLRPDPEWRWTSSATYAQGPWTLRLSWQHLSGLTKDSVAYGTADASEFVVPNIPSFNYFDLAGSVAATENMTFRFGINNLFDKQPPVVGNDYGGTAENSGNTFPATYDALGRSYFVGATVRF